MNSFRNASDLEDLSVSITELLVATSDDADALVDAAVPEVLRLLRERLQMDVVFVSEFVDGQRVFRFVDQVQVQGVPPISVGDANPLEATCCQRMIDGRLPERVVDADALRESHGLPPVPFRVGAHLSTAIHPSDGSTYGTLCSFSTQPNPRLQEQDLVKLKHCARLVARKLETRRAPPDAIGAGSKAWKDTAPAPSE